MWKQLSERNDHRIYDLLLFCCATILIWLTAVSCVFPIRILYIHIVSCLLFIHFQFLLVCCILTNIVHFFRFQFHYCVVIINTTEGKDIEPSSSSSSAAAAAAAVGLIMIALI